MKSVTIYVDIESESATVAVRLARSAGYEVALVHQEFAEVPRLDVGDESYFGLTQITQFMGIDYATREQPTSLDSDAPREKLMDLTDDEVRVIRMLVRSYGSVARSNAQDEMLSEAERRSSATTYRVCAGLLAKLRTGEERLSAELAQGALVG